MNNKPSIIITLIMVTLAFFAFTKPAQSQEGQDLLNQLTGKADSPFRNAEQFTEAYQKAIDYLMPLMANDENPRVQYEWQLALQDLGSYASRPGAELERQSLAKVMIKTLEEKEMPNTLKNWFVLQLERIGKAESVPALAKLLSNEDKHLRDYARTALEKNPDSSATDALLKELNSASDLDWKVGLLNSLGERKAESAVPTIIKSLEDSNQKVAATAVTALSDIANQAAIRALSDVIKKPASPIYLKAAQGLVDIALVKASTNNQDAGKIYDTIYESTTAAENRPDITSVRIAAINGMINCNPEKGADLIAGFIKDNNPKIRLAAVTGARQSSSDAPAKALSEILPDLEPDTQIQVLGLIGDRRDISSINQVEKMLQSDNQQVRIASIDTMSKLGDATSAKSLFDIAVNGRGTEKAAAHEGLVKMMGTNIEITINSNSSSNNVPSRVEAIKLMGERRMADSLNKLLQMAAEDNEQISSAAFKALANIADESSITTLVSLITQTENENARNSGITTLKSILSKAQNKSSAVQIIIDQINKSRGQIKLSLISTLNALGGSRALTTVVETAKSSDDETLNIGIRTLCDWPDYEAIGNLFDIASDSDTSLTHYVLATRGILRLIQEDNSVDVEEKADLCLKVYDITRRDDEKRQVIATMATLASTKIADRLLEIAQDGNLKAEAGLAVVQLANNILRTDREAAQSLAQKILDMNISEDINYQAQTVISGRNRGRGGFGGGMDMFMRGRGTGPVERPDKEARLASIKELETQLAALKAAIEKSPEKDPDFTTLEGEALTEIMESYTAETQAINSIQQTVSTLRDSSAGGMRGGMMRGMGGMGMRVSPDVLAELRKLADDEKATKTTERIEALIKEAQDQNNRRGGFGGN